MNLSKAKDLVAAAERVLVFTGAGISTGSGIKDFRGPQGVWKKRQPVLIQEFMTSDSKRKEYWDYKLEGYDSFRMAEPNAAHLALGAFDKTGRMVALVTQNVDGLHAAGGVADERLMELHGTNRLVACLSCEYSEPPAKSFESFAADGEPPVCPKCDGWLKPATISFGQQLNSRLLERAFEAAESADLVISLGSTLSVQPACSVPLTAVRNGAPYIVINQGETAHDSAATVLLEADLVEIVPQLLF